MAFLQLRTKDLHYYNLCSKKDFNIEELKNQLKNPNYLEKITKIIPFPTENQVEEHKLDDTVAFLSAEKLKYNNMFVKHNLPNSLGIKTLQQELYDEDINQVLYNDFGITAVRSKVKFKDLGGFDEPKRDAIKAIDFINKGHIKKYLSIFSGVSRAGKTFFAECLAGELGKLLIIMDVGKFIASENPAQHLDDFMEFMEQQDDYIILFDEIEKVVDPSTAGAVQKVMMNKLLTMFNNLNTPSGYQVGDNLIIATANNISDLRKKNPEFLNRFNFRYAIEYPGKESFINVADKKLSSINMNGITAQEIWNESTKMYPDFGEAKKGKYVSGEIAILVEQLSLVAIEKDDSLYCDKEILKETLRSVIPQIKYAEIGVNSTISSTELSGFKRVS